LPGSALNAACLVHDISDAGSHGGAAGERRADAPGYVTGTNATADALSRYRGRPGSTARSRRSSSRHFLAQILQGTSVPRQRAAGQIPPNRTGHLNEAPGRRCIPFPASAGPRRKRPMAMCAADDVSPDAQYCDKARPGRWAAHGVMT